jgi:shikimate kinase
MEIPAIIRNIILLGPKHSGKTSTGRELAKLLNGAFIDLDEFVEAQTGQSPRTLFKKSPETFHAAELQALKSFISSPPVGRGPGGTGTIGRTSGAGPEAPGGPMACIPEVIAAGGGIIDNAGARKLLLTAEGIFLVSLDVSAETAWERVSMTAAQNGELPPFLNTENPRETHRLLHERRMTAYRDIAHLSVSGEGKTPGEMGLEILGLFNKSIQSAENPLFEDVGLIRACPAVVH